MIEIIVLAAIAAAGMLLLVFKLAPMKRILGYSVIIDIIITVALCYMMAGTFTGIIIALIAGTMISLVLTTLAKTVGTEKLTFKGWKTA